MFFLHPGFLFLPVTLSRLLLYTNTTPLRLLPSSFILPLPSSLRGQPGHIVRLVALTSLCPRFLCSTLVLALSSPSTFSLSSRLFPPLLLSSAPIVPPIPEHEEPHYPRVGGGHLLGTLQHPPDDLEVGQSPSEDASSNTSQTLDEPQHEPSRQVSKEVSEHMLDDSVVEAEIKRQRLDLNQSSTRGESSTAAPSTDNRVQTEVSRLELQRLERDALRELRRLEREDRQQAALSRRNPTSGFTHFFSSHHHDPSNLDYFTIKKENDSFVAKPVKSKGGEFDMKSATPEEIKGFQHSDTEEWEVIPRRL